MLVEVLEGIVVKEEVVVGRIEKEVEREGVLAERVERSVDEEKVLVSRTEGKVEEEEVLVEAVASAGKVAEDEESAVSKNIDDDVPGGKDDVEEGKEKVVPPGI